MGEIENSFLLLKKSISKNKDIKNIFLDTFPKFNYSFFFGEMLPDEVEKRAWERGAFDISRGIIDKNLIIFLPPTKEFEIKLPTTFYLEFLPDFKFGVSFKKQIKDVVIRFYKDGLVSVSGDEEEKKFSVNLCPKDSFYNLLSLICLLMNAGVYDKNSLKIVQDNFPDSCFFSKISKTILENIGVIENTSKEIFQKIPEDFFWKNGAWCFRNIINQEDYLQLYSLPNFPKNGFSSHYSFAINDFRNEFEFFFKEFENLEKKRVYRNIKDEELKDLIPEFIKIRKTKNKKYSYEISLDYGALKNKSRDVIILGYNIEKGKLEKEDEVNTTEIFNNRVNAFLQCDIAKSFFVTVEKTLLDYCAFSKTQDKKMFEPLEKYFVLIKKILINSCTAQLLVARI